MSRGVSGIIFLLILGAALFAQGADYAPFRLNYPPGTYSKDILLQISADTEFDSILYRLAGYDDSQLISHSEPLLLSTPDGSSRSYHLELMLISRGAVVRTGQLDYTIDKRHPGALFLDKIEGMYTAPLSIFPSAEGADLFSYVLSGPGGSEQGTVNAGGSIELEGRSSEVSAYQLQISAGDNAGNSTASRTFRYVIDRRAETRVDSIPLLSPVQGAFANPQLLYIDDRGFSELRYSLDGSDPRLSELRYHVPVMLPAGKGIDLRVYGITHDGRELYASRRFSAGIDEYSPIAQGTVTANIEIPALRSGLFYRADDRPVGKFDSPLDRPLRISLQSGSLRALPLRIYDAEEDSEYRYFFLMDGRVPRAPDISLYSFDQSNDDYRLKSSGESISRRIMLRSNAEEGTRVFYSIRGELPSDTDMSDPRAADELSELVGDDELVLPEDLSELQLVVQVLKNGNVWSPARRLSYPVPQVSSATDQPEAKVSFENDAVRITPGDLPLGETLSLELTPALDDASPVTRDAAFQPSRAIPIDKPTRIAMPPGISQNYHLSIRRVDEVGRLSAASLEDDIQVDTLLVSGPQIEVRNRMVTLEDQTVVSPGGTAVAAAPAGETAEPAGIAGAPEARRIFYRLIRIGADEGELGGDFQEYLSPFRLAAEDGRNIAYIVEAYSEGPEGRSSTSRSDVIPVHTVTPATAELLGLDDGASVQGHSIRLFIKEPEPGVRYYYSIGRDGEVPRNPFPDGEYSTGEISISESIGDSGVPPANQEISLLIVPVSGEDVSLKGADTRFSFNFDNSPPAVPRLSGVVSGGEYNGNVQLFLSSENGTRTYYQLRRDDGEYVVDPDSLYREGYIVSGIEGRKVLYILDAYAVDGAGNQSEDLKAEFTVDREFPDFPRISVKNARGQEQVLRDGNLYVSSETLSITFDSSEGVVYELARDDEVPRAPDANSPQVSTALKFDADSGSERDYSLVFRSIDSAGNLGRSSDLYHIVIDSKAPDQPLPPQITRDGNSGYISWNLSDDYNIEYMIAPMGLSQPGNRDFEVYQYPRSWNVSNNEEGLVLYYRSRDEAGNTSALASLDLPRLQIAPVPKLSGVQDGGVYVQPREVEVFPGNGGLVRYELTTDGTRPPDVTENSPVWSSRLRFQASSGETILYRVRMRQFIPGYEPSSELTFSFSIDRTPPLPPDLRNIEDHRYSLEPVNLDFLIEDDGQAVYQIGEYVYPKGELPMGWGEDFTAPSGMDMGELSTARENISLDGFDDELVLYNIRAYSYDAAGNRSTQDRTWNIIVDRRNIFVAPAASADGTGSRDLPLNNIPDAIDFARRSGRSEIYLSSGNYPLLAPLNIDYSVGIYGSYNTKDWEKQPDEPSYLYADKSYSSPVLLKSLNNRLSLDSLFISDSARDLDDLILADNSDLRLKSCQVSVTGSSTGIHSRNSTIRVQDSEINGYELKEATVIRLENQSSLSLKNSRVSAEELPSFLETGLHGSYILIHSQDSRVESSASQVLPASGDSTIAVYLYNSNFQGDAKSRFTSGYGRSAATAFYLENSNLNLRSSTVEGNSDAAVVSLISGRNSDITLSDSDVNMVAGFGVNGVSLSGGTLNITGSHFSGLGGQDFVNAVTVRSSTELNITRSSFTGADSAEYVFLTLEDSKGDVRGNDFQFSGNEEYGIAVDLGNNAACNLESNNFQGSIYATAIRLQTRISEIQLEVSNNNFENWGLLLEEFRSSFRSSQQQAGRYQTLQQIESIDEDGIIFSDNSIRQGL